MKNIIFIAPPAAGKGTMSTLLKNKYNYVHISTGDLLRDAKSKNDEFGKMLAGMLSSGKLVPDEIVLELLENRIKQDDAKKGFILDGYPRNIKQVDSLIKLFNELNINDYAPLYLDEQPCNKEDCYKMFYVLSKIFNVSKEVIKYRLKNENLLLTSE